MIIDTHVHVGGDEAGFCMNEELVKMIADNRDVIVALKVHPTLSNLSFSDEKMEPYMYGQYLGSLKDIISKEDYENLMENTARKIFGLK